jgi:hypothetical protein
MSIKRATVHQLALLLLMLGGNLAELIRLRR